MCGPHLGSARGGNLRVNLLRKLCFRGLKMESAGPLFLGWAGHTRKNRGGCAGLTVSELGLSLLSFSSWTIASKTCRTGWWGAKKRRGGGQGLFKFSVSHFFPFEHLSSRFPIAVFCFCQCNFLSKNWVRFHALKVTL